MLEKIGVSIIFYIVGFGFFGVSLYGLRNYKKVELNGRKTKAKIIDYKEEIKTDSEGIKIKYFFPIITFNNEVGEMKTLKLTYGEGKPKYKINSTVSISYLKNNSDYEIIINDGSEKNLYFFLISLGLFFILIASGLLIKSIYY